jgi:hypothetical protein
MNIGRRNSSRGILAAVILAILTFVLLVQYAPDSVAFSPNNYGWNGLHEVSSAYNVNFTTSLSSLPNRAVLAVLQPNVNFSSAGAKSVKNFLLGGGTVLVADKSGVANSLLVGIGAAIAIESQYSISDPVYNWKARTVPTALVLPSARSACLVNVSGIALNQPSPLALANSEASPVAVTSQFSETQVGAKGPFVVMASEKFGKGSLIVIGDSQFLLNSEWTIADNKVLIGNLFANKSVLIDASHWMNSPLTSSTAQMKAELRQIYATISAVPLRYVLVLLMVGVALVLVPSREESRNGQRQPRTAKASGEWARSATGAV